MLIPAKFEKYNILALALILFFIPFNVHFIPLMTVVLAVGVLLQENKWINMRQSIKQLDNKLFLYSSVFLFVLLHVGMLYTVNAGDALREIRKQLALLLIPFLLLLFNRELLIRYRKELLWALTFGVLISSIYMFFMAYQLSWHIDEHGNRFFNVSVWPEYYNNKNFWQLIQLRSTYFSYSYLTQNFHPSYLALIVNVALSFLLLQLEFFWRKRNYILLLITAFAIAYFSFFQYLLQARSGMITYIVIMALMIFKLLYSFPSIRKYYPLILILFISATFILVRYTFIYKNVKGLLAYEETQSTSKLNDKRVYIWQSAWHVIQRNPIWGVGTGDVKTALNEQMLEDKNPLQSQTFQYDSHNQFLYYWLSLGIIGLLVFIFWLGIPIVSAIKNNDFLLLMVWFNVSINFLFETMLSRAIGAIFITLMLSLLIYTNKKAITE
jgi:hypothetical protein